MKEALHIWPTRPGWSIDFPWYLYVCLNKYHAVKLRMEPGGLLKLARLVIKYIWQKLGKTPDLKYQRKFLVASKEQKLFIE